MTEEEKHANKSKELSAPELLKIIRDISAHAENEVSRVTRMYKIAAMLILAIATVGIIFTYKDAAEFRQESRAEIDKQQELIRNEIERQEKQMHERQDTMLSLMQLKLDQQMVLLSQTVEERVDTEFKAENIKSLVENKARERIDAIADTLITDKIKQQIQPKIYLVDKDMQKVKGEIQLALDDLKEVQDDANFLSVLSRALNDDRNAFDQLDDWANDPNFYRQADAAKAWWQVVDNHESWLHLDYKVPWNEGIDPSEQSFSQLAAEYYRNESPTTRIALLQYIWERSDFTRIQKMGLMIQAMKNDTSLKVVAEASRLFQEESKQKKKTLLIDYVLDWWEKNKDTINEKPK